MYAKRQTVYAGLVSSQHVFVALSSLVITWVSDTVTASLKGKGNVASSYTAEYFCHHWVRRWTVCDVLNILVSCRTLYSCSLFRLISEVCGMPLKTHV